eukprot:521324-Pyramimonas_sp.AAC.1
MFATTATTSIPFTSTTLVSQTSCGGGGGRLSMVAVGRSRRTVEEVIVEVVQPCSLSSRCRRPIRTARELEVVAVVTAVVVRVLPEVEMGATMVTVIVVASVVALGPLNCRGGRENEGSAWTTTTT